MALGLLFSLGLLNAQQLTVSGMVINNQNQPVHGARVVSYPGNAEAITGSEGTFELQVSQENVTLVCSKDGYLELSMRGGRSLADAR